MYINFIYSPIINMTNPNVIKWIGSVENLNNKKEFERPFHQNEQQFYLIHPPMPTENGKKLKEFFNEREILEHEKSELEKKEQNLKNKFDELNHTLRKVQEKPATTPEEQIRKQEEINRIREEIHKVTEELKKVRKDIKEIDNEIDNINEKINQMIEIVLEDEHKDLQQQQELEKQNNREEVKLLINQL